ncbi:MAG: 3D domain-containing protein [Myxococcota bacterium]
MRIHRARGAAWPAAVLVVSALALQLAGCAGDEAAALSGNDRAAPATAGGSAEHSSDRTRPTGSALVAAASRLASAQPEPSAAEDAPAPPKSAAADDQPLELGEFQLTYYWVAHQKRDKKEVQLYTQRCKPLAKVSRAFARRLGREGTGKLSDGRTINISGTCKCPRSPCYFALSDDQRWGVGVGHRPLSPFRSVAVDPEIVPIGTLLYIPELDGLTVPGRRPWGGFVHDGCVVADDRGGAIEGKELDLFMVKKSHYQAFDRRHRLKRVSVQDGRHRCKQQNGKLVPVNRNSI